MKLFSFAHAIIIPGSLVGPIMDRFDVSPQPKPPSGGSHYLDPPAALLGRHWHDAAFKALGVD